MKLLRDEYGFESFYNIALTPWLYLTPDIQITRGAQREKITPQQGLFPVITSRETIGTTTVMGLRMQIVF